MKKLFLNERIIISIILLNSVLIFLEGFNQFNQYELIFNNFHYIFLIIYILELLFKIHEFGFKNYIKEGLNKLDFLLVVISFPELFALISNLEIKNKTFIEFGVENYSEANTKFLLLNKNWSGFILDSSNENIDKHFKTINKFIKEAIDNIRGDRETTRELLDDAMRYLAVDQSRHRDMGQTLAKYVETLQRSNEQLVKLCGLMSKNEKTDELTDKDFAQIFEQIQKSEEK